MKFTSGILPGYKTSCSADSPVLWLRVDKDMNLLRSVTWEQPDYMWQYQLKYERDVVAQGDVSIPFCVKKLSKGFMYYAFTDSLS